MELKVLLQKVHLQIKFSSIQKYFVPCLWMSLGLKWFCNRHVMMVQMTVTFLLVTMGSSSKKRSFVIRLRLWMASAFLGSPLEKIYTSVLWWWFNQVKPKVKQAALAVLPCFLFISHVWVERGSETVLCTLQLITYLRKALDKSTHWTEG